ncbi:hypothetical protein ACK6VY_09480 [Proteus mirabilis]|uniref:hypothetical protein n=1 Tax=Proteus mirabilis TaxID=584 RepID=UPI0039B3F8D3
MSIKSGLEAKNGNTNQLNKFCKKNEFEKFTPRDVRITFKTLSGDMGISSELRDMVQNHKRPGVSQKYYDRYDYLREKRETVDIWREKRSSLKKSDVYISLA